MAGSAVPAAVIADAVAAAKGWLRASGADDDAAVAGAMAAALALAEAFCGEALVARGWEDVLARESGWQRLRARPVTAIAGLTAVPAGAAPFVLPVEAYAVDIDADGIGWVRVAAAERVAVSYTAGRAATWAAVPAPVAQGVVLLAAHLLDNKAADVVPPAAVAALWRPFRRLALAEARR